MKKYLLIIGIILISIFAVLTFSSCTKEKDSDINLEEKQIIEKIVEIKILDFNQVSLPVSLKYEGKIDNGYHWSDALGDNYLIFTSKIESSDYGSSKYIYAYHYAKSNDESEFKLIKDVRDFVKECECDLNISFIDEATRITDIDKNGKAEITLLYTMGCHCDPGPDVIKLLMIEDGHKFAIRGETILISKDKTFDYRGKKLVDKEFYKTNPSFLEHANKLWDKYFKKNSSINEW